MVQQILYHRECIFAKYIFLSLIRMFCTTQGRIRTPYNLGYVRNEVRRSFRRRQQVDSSSPVMRGNLTPILHSMAGK